MIRDIIRDGDRYWRVAKRWNKSC